MRFVKAALAAAAAAAVAIAIFLRARRRRLRAKKIAYINTEDAAKWHDQLEVFAAALRLPAPRPRARASIVEFKAPQPPRNWHGAYREQRCNEGHRTAAGDESRR